MSIPPAPHEHRRPTGPRDTSRAIADLSPWFHNLHLPDGSQTAPDHVLGDFPANKWRSFRACLPARLDGFEVLDIGCNAGFYSIELAGRGARVTAIDINEHYLSQARWAAAHFGLAERIEFEAMSVYQLARRRQRYDLVLFMGTFYHLRYPMLALDIVAGKVKRLLAFQTLTMPGEEVFEMQGDFSLNERADFLRPGWPKMAFVEHRLANDPTNWWVANHAAVLAMLRSSGMRVVERPAHEIYICEPGGDQSGMSDMIADELHAACGITSS